MVATRPARVVETFDWLEPAPLWDAPAQRTGDNDAHYQPAIVELTSDAFMGRVHGHRA